MSYHILCVDDNQGFLNILEKTLRNRYQITTVSTLEDAKIIVRTDPVDLVFLDVNLGSGQDGIQGVKALKQVDSSIIVIMLSGQKDPDLVVQAIQNGASDYLCKPHPHNELIEVIEKNLARKNVNDQNQALIEELNTKESEHSFIGDCSAVRYLMESLDRLKGHDASILISGESGTGKEVLARKMHEIENNSKRPFIAVNCAAIPENLIESELFGHEKGAFTGAIRRKIGKFELAKDGDLFLDEINSLKPELQAKLLRVLQEKEFYRVGGNDPIKVNARIIAASNTDLEKEVEQGHFRQDLLYRLRVIHLTMPALRERMEDLPALIQHFLTKHDKTKAKSFGASAIQVFSNYAWPGNIRELENLIQSLVIMSPSDVIEAEHLPAWFGSGASATLARIEEVRYPKASIAQMNQSLKELIAKHEHHYIKKALQEFKGNVSQVAKVLKVSRNTVYAKMAELESENG